MVSAITNNVSPKVCIQCSRQFTGGESMCPSDGTMLVALMQDPLIGSTLAGCYQIQSLLGTGGMGVVYKARHGLMDRIVAIKMLQAQLVSDQLSVARFHQESKAASRINHPNVITIYDFGISPQGLPYIVMDYLVGAPLSDVIKEQGQVSVDRTLKIIIQTCDALAHAHKQGVVHRDLKPGNIVLTTFNEEKDFVKVVDFGVAKLMNQDGQRLTQAGEVCGSPVYMSPEQCMGQELDLRSDIYSMGIVLYETLTGKLPILGKTMVDTMSKHCSEMPAPFKTSRPDLYIPERLETIIFKALAKDPDERHQSMDELRNELVSAIPPRAGRTSTLRSASELAEDIPGARTFKKAANVDATKPGASFPKSSLVFMCLGAALTLVAAFVGVQMFSGTKTPNKQVSTSDLGSATKSKEDSTSEKSYTGSAPKIETNGAASKGADSKQGTSVEGESESEVAVEKEAQKRKHGSSIEEMVTPSHHTLGALQKSDTASKGVASVKKMIVHTPLISAELKRPKRPKRADRPAASEAPVAHSAPAKSGKNPWDSLRSQLSN